MDNFNVYVTINGDTWDMIAYKVYGNTVEMNLLQDANPELAKIFIFPADIYIRCPIKESNQEVKSPWAR